MVCVVYIALVDIPDNRKTDYPFLFFNLCIHFALYNWLCVIGCALIHKDAACLFGRVPTIITDHTSLLMPHII